MSAAFQYSNEFFWGTNLTIKFCLEIFEKIAVEEYGADHTITEWCREQQERFFNRTVIVLDPLFESANVRKQFVSLVIKSEKELLKDRQWTEVGLNWVTKEIPRLAATIDKQNHDTEMGV